MSDKTSVSFRSRVTPSVPSMSSNRFITPILGRGTGGTGRLISWSSMDNLFNSSDSGRSIFPSATLNSGSRRRTRARTPSIDRVSRSMESSYLLNDFSPALSRRNIVFNPYNFASLPLSGLTMSNYPKNPYRQNTNSHHIRQTRWEDNLNSPRYHYFRPKIRERPSLASIKCSIKRKHLNSPPQFRPTIKSTLQEPQLTSISSTASVTSSCDEANMYISRYRPVIKFREHHHDEPVQQRKASISFMLSSEFLSSSLISSPASSIKSRDSSGNPELTVPTQSEREEEENISDLGDKSDQDEGIIHFESPSSPSSPLKIRYQVSVDEFDFKPPESPKTKTFELEDPPDLDFHVHLSPKITTRPETYTLDSNNEDLNNIAKSFQSELHLSNLSQTPELEGSKNCESAFIKISTEKVPLKFDNDDKDPSSSDQVLSHISNGSEKNDHLKQLSSISIDNSASDYLERSKESSEYDAKSNVLECPFMEIPIFVIPVSNNSIHLSKNDGNSSKMTSPHSFDLKPLLGDEINAKKEPETAKNGLTAEKSDDFDGKKPKVLKLEVQDLISNTEPDEELKEPYKRKKTPDFDLKLTKDAGLVQVQGITRKKNETNKSKKRENSEKQTGQQKRADLEEQKKEVAHIVDEKFKAKKRIRFRPYMMDDFVLKKVLGRGSFGKVFLAQLKDHDDHFAIKFLKKHVVIEDDDLESIMIERKVLALGVRHPFICKLFCTFQTKNLVCFVMEFLAGGDLMFHVQSNGKFSEDRTRFYAAETVSALNFLHGRYIVYRDLKLDNILLDEKGHIRLVDFGMCQCHIYKEECLPSNFCGTPEYMAPEIIKGVQYNHAVDWWSFGVLLYEMLCGDSPFKGTDEDELLWNVCYEKVRYPLYLSDQSRSIISLCLERDPIKRLGMATSPAGKIKNHKFFATIDWDLIENGNIKPPFVPNLKHSADTSYFDREFTEMRPVLTPIDDMVAEKLDHELFNGFDYTNPNMTD